MYFKDMLIAHLEYLNRRLSQVSVTIKKLPEGTMITKISRGKTFYYEKKTGKLHNLKNQPEKIQLYIKKKQLARDIPILTKNIKSLERLLASYIPLQLDDAPWNAINPQQNKYKENELRHLYNGVYYRSKSEAMIAALLNSYCIEFRTLL